MTTPNLERSIGIVRATAMVVGTIIGASIFVQPSHITGHVPSIAGVFAVWAAAGLLTLFGALVCAELASAYPRTGGVYVFLKDVGPLPAKKRANPERALKTHLNLPLRQVIK